MPAAARRMQKLKKGAQGEALRYGAQMGGPVAKGRYANQMRGPGGGARLRGPGEGMEKLRRPIDSRLAKGPSAAVMPDRAPGGPAPMPRPDKSQVQGPAVMPPEPAAAPIPADAGGDRIDMGPAPKGIQEGSPGGGRLARPGSGLIKPAAPIRPLDGGEAVPAAAPVVAQAAPIARGMAMRQPMSGFQPRKKPTRRPGRFFTGGAQGMM